MTDETLAALEAQFDGAEQPPIVIDQDMMARRLVWDLVPHSMADATIKTLGMTGVSEEVEGTEHEMSHYRAFNSAHLTGVMWAMSEQIADIQIATIKNQDPSFNIDPQQLTPLLFTATKAILDEFLDLNVLFLQDQTPEGEDVV